ncbi:MAG: LuxR family transcriptional regulator, partial [Bacteroidota bacterium]
TLFLVEDHPIFIEGLKSIFDHSEDFKVKGTARNGKEAIERMYTMQNDLPEIILMDLSMPEMDGIEATKVIKKEFPECYVIILTGHKERAQVRNSISAKVDGYMLKESVGNEITCAIDEIKNGNKYFSPSVQSILVDIALSGNETSNYDLTTREIEILERVVNGKTSLEIGKELFISENTVNIHRRNIHRMLNVNTVTELIAKVYKEGLLQNFISDNIQPISPKERQVLHFLNKDKTSQEISDEMGISVHTVNNHRQSIRKKLRVHNTKDLLDEARKLNLL